MYIKPNTLIPANITITKVASSVSKAKSVYSLARRHERQLEAEADIERRNNAFNRAIAVGYSVVEAAKFAAENY